MLHPSLRKSSRKCFLGTSIQESRKCRICHEPEGAGKWAYELWMEDEGSWMWVGWRKEEEMGVLVETRLISMAASLVVCLTHLPCLWLLYVCFHLFLSYCWLERIATWMEGGFVGCEENMNLRRSKLRLKSISQSHELFDKLCCNCTWEAAWEHHTRDLVLGKLALSQAVDTNLYRNTAYNWNSFEQSWKTKADHKSFESSFWYQTWQSFSQNKRERLVNFSTSKSLKKVILNWIFSKQNLMLSFSFWYFLLNAVNGTI